VVSDAANSQMFPAVASNGAGTMIVWRDYRTGSSYDIYGARVDQAGVVLEPAGIVISTAAGAQRYPEVGFDGTNYLAVWEDRRGGTSYDVYGARVSPAGTVLDPAGIAIAKNTGDDLNLSLAPGGAGTSLVVWDAAGLGRDVVGARVDSSGAVLDASSILVSGQVRSQERGDAAFDGTNWLLVWSESLDSGRDIRGVRVSPAGAVLDATPLHILDDQPYVGHPRVAFDGTNYLVVWEDTLDPANNKAEVWGARVTPSGMILDPGGFVIATGPGGQSRPEVAFGGGQYVVAYADDTDIANGPDVYAVRVMPDGAVLDATGIPIVKKAGAQEPTDIAWDGKSFLIVWGGSGLDLDDVAGARLSPTGVVLDPGTIPFGVGSAHVDAAPAIASNGADFFVVWERLFAGVAPSGIVGTRISEGAIVDPNGISIASNASAPAIAFDGAHYVVAFDVGAGDIHAARVDAGGKLIDATPFAVAAEPTMEGASVASAGPPGQVLLAYELIDDAIGGSFNRARIISEEAVGGAGGGGGMAGSGGAAGSGGGGGMGGFGGMGGSSGMGGSGGSPGEGGAGGSTPDAVSLEGGCACRTAPSSAPAAPFVAFGVALVGLARRRRRGAAFG